METIHGEPGLAKSFKKWVAAGIGLALFSFTTKSLGQTYELVHAFRDAGKPMSALIQASDGDFYGTTYSGGSSGVGTIFKVDSNGNLTTVHSFGYTDGASPTSGLIQATDGNFYGTTTLGGTSNRGVIFRMDASGNVSTLHSFNGSDGATPHAPLIQATDGNLYGTTFDGGGLGHIGTVFKADLSGNLTVLYRFSGADGSCPYAALFQASDGDFYGTTAGGGESGRGTVFKIDTQGNLTSLHSFHSLSDGADPYATLIQATDGNFYGTTRGGGASEGTIYRMNAVGEVTVLYSFMLNDGLDPYAPLIQATDGNFYGASGIGTLQSTIFKMEALGSFSVLHRFGYDSADPYAGLIQASDGSLYGTASAGGEGGRGIGSIFKVDLDGAFTTLHAFQSTEPLAPQSAVIEGADGNFYGTTAGGEGGAGTIYRMDTFGGLTTLHAFGGSDGASPLGSLIQASNGKFYGTTEDGGTGGYGTVFQMETFGDLTTLHSFDHSDGAYPHAALIQAADGDFYGTTYSGGSNDEWGSVFKIDAAGQLTTLHSFDGSSGAYPEGGVVQAADGDFYGTTALSVFKTDSSGNFTKLCDFDESYGFGSKSGLIQVEDGTFYGTSAGGGESGKGTVFSVDSSAVVNALHSFGGGDGTYPEAALLQAADGKFYGTTLVGGDCVWSGGCGTIFRIDASGDFESLHSFSVLDGRWPMAALTQASDGSLYGTTHGGGPFGGRGVIFRLSTASVAINEVSPRSGPGSAGGALDLLGGGFLEGATVTVGGRAGTDVKVLDRTFLYLATPALAAGTLNDVSVTVPDGLGTATATHPNAFFADFLDVPQIHPFHDFVERIFREAITAGCAAGSYCPDDPVTRAQMSVLLLKSEHGAGYLPPPCAGSFADVPCPSMFADWIEQLAAEGVTAGCGGGQYCPASPVTRAQMAAFLLKTKNGAAYLPPACTGIFGDVPCPSLFADWIEQLAAEKITGGCGSGDYCPESPNTRGQMAVFLVKTFGL